MGNLTNTDAAFIARKLGFAASPGLLNEIFAIADKKTAILHLLQQSSDLTDLPEWHDLMPQDIERDKDTVNQMKQELWQWWHRQMVETRTPFNEVMVLFWHNHFVSSVKKVKWAPTMLAQNQLFRKHGTGSFRALLDGIIHDAAMLIYLDNDDNKKSAPNENLARELLELFTLGEGNYTEQDIKELARALTGATVSKKTGRYVFRKRIHDKGEKTIFGQTGKFGPDDIADLILAQPECARFIVQKLWRYFTESPLKDEELNELADLFTESDFHLQPVLEHIFLSDAFWASAGTQIKSPVHLVIGCQRLIGFHDNSAKQFRRFAKGMGQLLFMPPNVKGWPGGAAWYSSSYIPERERFSKLVNRELRNHPDLSLINRYLLSVTPMTDITNENDKTVLKLTLLDPAFQVV